MTPGVATLFKVGAAEAKGELAEPKETDPALNPGGSTKDDSALPNSHFRAHRRLIKGSLVTADLVIVGLVAWVLLVPGRPVTTLEILLSSLAVMLGAWLTCLALLLD